MGAAPANALKSTPSNFSLRSNRLYALHSLNRIESNRRNGRDGSSSFRVLRVCRRMSSLLSLLSSPLSSRPQLSSASRTRSSYQLLIGIERNGTEPSRRVCVPVWCGSRSFRCVRKLQVHRHRMAHTSTTTVLGTAAFSFRRRT